MSTDIGIDAETSKDKDPDLSSPDSSRRALPSSDSIRIGEDVVMTVTTPEPTKGNNDDNNNSDKNNSDKNNDNNNNNKNNNNDKSELVHNDNDNERSEQTDVVAAQPKISPTSSKMSGRPPRPGAKAGSKSSQSQQQQQQQQQHKPEQIKSPGDNSFISPLTSPGDGADGSGAFQPTTIHSHSLLPTLERPRNIRNRSVSFGDGVAEGQTSTQPMPRPQLSNNMDQISFADLVSPMETEAETAIFRALESHRRQVSSAFDFIFPNVPDDSVHLFERQDSWDRGAASTTGSHQEKKDTDSVVTSVSVAQMKIEEPPASPSKKSAAPLPKPPSLESTLFGLSAAMRGIHGTTNETSIITDGGGDSQSKPGWLSSSTGIAPGDGGDGAKMPKNDQDTFVRNANLLFRRHLSSRDLGSAAPTTTAPVPSPALKVSSQSGTTESKSSRKLLGGQVDVPADPKKTDVVQENGDDDDDVVGIDIEMGDTSDRTKISSGKVPESRRKSFGGELAKTLLQGTRKISEASKELARQTQFGIKEDFLAFNNFLKPREQLIKKKAKFFVLYILTPTLLTSTLLFYAFGNPKMARGCETSAESGRTVCPSVSWFLNFLVLRQTIAFALGRATQLFFIDYLALKTSVLLRAFGPVATLMIVGSKGWPFLIGTSAMYSLILNSGKNQFARNWLFFQKGIEMFNESNPSGSIPDGEWNRLILWTLISLGLFVSVKRFLVGLYLGKRTCAIYGRQLAKVLQQMFIISQLGRLGRECELRMTDPAMATSLKLRHNLYDINRVLVGTNPGEDGYHTDGNQTDGYLSDGDPSSNLVDNSKPANKKSGSKGGADSQDGRDNFPTEHRDVLKGSTRRMKLMELLDAWEEPERETGKDEHISINATIQFSKTMAFMDYMYPFGDAFGLADTREHCLESSQGVYRRLMLKTPGATVLPFETIASLGSPTPDTVDVAKVKDLIRLFRPDREGNLTMIDFVKSVDAVYKEVRQLRASIKSTSQIARATEVMINVFFYFTVFCVILARLKIDPLQFFLSISSVIIAFAFMIGSASAKYFEGIMFILVRRPYDVGDRISISEPTDDTPADGSSTWFVESVDLYTTTVRFATTNEVATLANGSLATTRIINAARSPKALVYLKLKFGVDVPYAKVQLFRTIVEAFVKARPREWLSLSGFRATKVEADLGYIEYVISCQHREGWQTIVPILQSKADLFSYCLEVQKQLNMRYTTPSVPVDLNISRRPTSSLATSQASNDEKDESMEPRRRTNTATAVEGIEHLAELFTIR